MDGKRHDLAALPSGKSPGSYCTGDLVGIRLAWMVRKILSLLPPHLQSIFEPRTVQPVANRNTDHNIQAAYQHKQQVIIWFKVTLLKTVTNIKLY